MSAITWGMEGWDNSLIQLPLSTETIIILSEKALKSNSHPKCRVSTCWTRPCDFHAAAAASWAKLSFRQCSAHYFEGHTHHTSSLCLQSLPGAAVISSSFRSKAYWHPIWKAQLTAAISLCLSPNIIMFRLHPLPPPPQPLSNGQWSNGFW